MSHHILVEKDPENQPQKVPAMYHLSEWVTKNQKKILMTVVALAVGVSFSVWRYSQKQTEALQDISQAYLLATELQKTDGNKEETLKMLEALNSKCALLQNRYDAIIAQELILQGKASQAARPIASSINKLEANGLSLFATFSKISGLHASGQLEKAYPLATQLSAQLATPTKEAIAKQIEANQFALHAFTLLEVASLEQKLKLTDKKTNAVTELKTLLGINSSEALSPEHTEAATSVRTILEENQSSILESL